MIPPRQFLDHVIRPVLSALAEVDPRYNHPAAERLLLGTAIKESGIEAMEQVHGPARSMFQIEPATLDWLWGAFVEKDGHLSVSVNRFVFRGTSPREQLAGNQHLACAMARLRYWAAPAALPAATDVEGMAAYWGRYYQTQRIPSQMAKWSSGFRKHTAGIWE